MGPFANWDTAERWGACLEQENAAAAWRLAVLAGLPCTKSAPRIELMASCAEAPLTGS